MRQALKCFPLRLPFVPIVLLHEINPIDIHVLQTVDSVQVFIAQIRLAALQLETVDKQ